MNLEALRKKINTADTQILKYISARQSYMKAVGEFKKKNNLPITHRKREAEILERLAKESIGLGINPEMIRKVFKLIIADAKRIQREVKK